MLRVGTHVIALVACDGNEYTYQQKGKIIDRDPNNPNFVLVEFVNDVRGHDGNGSIGKYRRRGKQGHCWWCDIDTLEKTTIKKVSTKQLVLKKMRRLWNESNYAKANPKVGY